jgi:COMPASS component SWD1
VADPFCSGAVPDTIEEYLEHGVARCIAFNRRGTLLAGAGRVSLASRARAHSRLTRALAARAAGCATGEVVLWDFETRGVARVLRGGHEGEVAALAWSRDGRSLASAGADRQLRVWDVLAGTHSAAATLAGKPVRWPAWPRAALLSALSPFARAFVQSAPGEEPDARLAPPPATRARR